MRIVGSADVVTRVTAPTSSGVYDAPWSGPFRRPVVFAARWGRPVDRDRPTKRLGGGTVDNDASCCVSNEGAASEILDGSGLDGVYPGIVPE